MCVLHTVCVHSQITEKVIRHRLLYSLVRTCGLSDVKRKDVHTDVSSIEL